MDTKIPTLTDRDRRLVCLWLKGVKMDAIRAEFGLSSRGIVIRRAQKLGLPHRSNRHGANAPVDLFPCIVAWAKQGFTPREIAVGIGCTNPDLIASVGATFCQNVRRETKSEFRERLQARIETCIDTRGKRSRRKRQAVREALEAA